VTKREVIIFFAGVEAFHTFGHLEWSVSGKLPIRIFGFTLTAGRNAWAIVVNAVITAALLWWAGRLKRGETTRRESS